MLSLTLILFVTEVIMQTILLSIAVWFTHFLTASSLNFNAPPSSTLGYYTENIFTTEATTETNQELMIPMNTTDLAPPVTMTQDSTTPKALTNEAQTHASLYTHVSVITTEETTTAHDLDSSTESQNDIIDGTKTTDSFMFYTNTSLASTDTSSAPQKEDKNETGRESSAHNMSYSNDRHTTDIWNDTTVKQPTSEPFNSEQTVFWKERTVNDTIKADEEMYEMSSTQATFANSIEETERTEGTTRSYGFTTKHMVLMHTEEHYTTPSTTDTTSATSTIENNWITSQNTDTPMTTTAYTTLDGMNITNAPENQSSIPGIVMTSGRPGEDSEANESTTHNIVTKENGTPSVTFNTTNNTNSSIIANVITDHINTTSIMTDTTNNLLPECFNTNPKQTNFRQSKLVCFITLWTLAMTASIFLGITIFLWVRLSLLKKRMKIKGGGQVEKGGQKTERKSLWADPKASVQERVEFWYVTGSTLEADRKERGKRREEKVKQKKEEQDKSENELWIQPRVTENDIEFWYANRRTKEERTRMGYF